MTDGPEKESDAAVPVPEPAVVSTRPGKKSRRVSGKAVFVIGARSVLALVGVAVAVAAVVTATVVTEPNYRVTPPAASVSPVAAAQQRVCPGPLLRLGNAAGEGASIASSLGPASVQFEASGGTAASEALATTENTAGTAPERLTLPPEPGGSVSAPALAGSQTQLIDSGDLVGLAAEECVEAGSETWLVGGATTLGRTTLVTISNPSTVGAVVDVSIFGERGAVSAPGAEGIVVEPGAQRIFSLAGFAPGLATPVVLVQSRGGQVVANLQQVTVRTLAPGGVDIVGATRAPSTFTIIPGLVISGAGTIAETRSEPGYEDLEASVRLFVPGENDTTATITISPEETAGGGGTGDGDGGIAIDGAVPGGIPRPSETSFEFDLLAGQVSDVPLPGLTDGRYTVTVASEEPVAAGVRVSTVRADGASDFAWLAAPTPLGPSALVSVAPGSSPVLHLANPGNSDASVSVESATNEVTIDVPAGGSASTPLQGNRDLTLTGAEGLLATVTYLGDGQIAAFSVTTPGPASGDITVYR